MQTSSGIQVTQEVTPRGILHDQAEVMICKKHVSELDHVLMHKITVHDHLALNHFCNGLGPCTHERLLACTVDVLWDTF